MGMFDKRQYLTGENGWCEVGDTFFLHRAKLDGVATINGEQRKQAKLEVSDTVDGARVVCFTTGGGIVRQIEDMDSADRAAMPFEVRLDELPASSADRNPTRVLTPASEPAPAVVGAAGDSGDDF